jgi:hypothetical protein
MSILSCLKLTHHGMLQMYLSAPLPRTIFQGALDGATNAITSTYPNIASPFFPDDEDLQFFVDVEALQALSMATLHMRPLIPNVEYLSWYYGHITKDVEGSMLQCICLFLAPKLTTLSIVLHAIFDGAWLPSILSGLINFCPALKDLTFLF